MEPPQDKRTVEQTPSRSHFKNRLKPGEKTRGQSGVDFSKPRDRGWTNDIKLTFEGKTRQLKHKILCVFLWASPLPLLCASVLYINQIPSQEGIPDVP